MDTSFSKPDSMWAVTPEKVDAAVRRAIEVAQPTAVYLFGSCVNPKADGSSPNDMDMLVVASGSIADTNDESVRIRAALDEICMPMDIVVATASRFKELATIQGMLYHEVLKTGRRGYESA